MNTTIRTTLLTGLFLFSLISGAQAQERYEFGSIRLHLCTTGKALISTSLPDGYTEKEVDKSEFQGKRFLANVSPFIKEMNELAKAGWEIQAVSNYDIGGGGCYVEMYTIKRNKK